MSKIKVKDFLLQLAKKAGVTIDTANPELVDLLSSNVEIPNTVADTLNTGLLTLDSAVENDGVRDRILAASFGAIDKDLLKKVGEFGLNDLTEEFKTEKSTRVKVNRLLEAVAEAERKKAGAKSADKGEYDKEIARLNAEAKKLRDDFEAEKGTLSAAHQQELSDLLLDNLLGGYDYADSEFGKEFVLKYAKDSVLQSLNSNKGKLVLDENKKLKVVKSDTGGELFNDKNERVELKGLVDSSVAKLLKKSDPNPPNPPKDKTVELGGGGNKADVNTQTQLLDLAASIGKG